MKIKKHWFKVKFVDEAWLAKYTITWECCDCGKEGAHTFSNEKPTKRRKDICATCDPEQFRELYFKNKPIGVKLPNDPHR